MSCKVLLVSTLAFGLCLSQCSGPTWLENRANHAPTDFTADFATLDYLINDLKNESDFVTHLDNIIIPRDVNTTNHLIVESYIETHLGDLGWTVETDEFTDPDTPIGAMRFKNIVAHMDPIAPRRVVLACHYETAPTIGDGFLGAMDAGASCAMLLNLATTMTDLLRQQIASNPELGISLVFFDGEEAMQYWSYTDSIYGSSHLATLWDNSAYDSNTDGFCQTEAADFLDRMELLYLFDLIGTSDPQIKDFRFTGSPCDDDPNLFFAMMKQIETVVDAVFPMTGDVAMLYSGGYTCKFWH